MHPRASTTAAAACPSGDNYNTTSSSVTVTVALGVGVGRSCGAEGSTCSSAPTPSTHWCDLPRLSPPTLSGPGHLQNQAVTTS